MRRIVPCPTIHDFEGSLPVMNKEELFNRLLPLVRDLSPTLQSIVIQLLAHEGPMTSAKIADAVDRSAKWVSGEAIPKLRATLHDVAVIDAINGPGGGYTLRLLTDEQRLAAALASGSDELEQVTIEDVPAPVAVQKVRTKHYYKCPWPGGMFDLREVIAINYDSGRVTVQLPKGGYQRGPVHPRAREVAEDIEACIAEIKGNVVHSFEARMAAYDEDDRAA